MYFIVTNNYHLESDKINEDKKIGLFADIHQSNIFKTYRYEQIINNLQKNNPTHICIPGDIIDATNILDKEYRQNELLEFMKRVGNIAPAYISLGSHDFTRFKTKAKIPSYEYLSFWQEEFRSLEKYNVFLLDNEILSTKDTRFIGYTPTYDYYYNETKSESEAILIDDFNRQFKKINPDKYNILLIHSPICILNDKVLKAIIDLYNIDLIVTGHMHNGMIPGILTKIIPTNKGLIAPNKSLFPDNTRGIKEVVYNEKKITLISSGGITKIQESAPNILHFWDLIYSPQIEYIKIKKRTR